MSDRPGRYTELSQRGIDENSLHGVTLNGGKSSDKKLDPKQFFLTVAKNLEESMLSQGGRLPDKTGYNKLIEEYWPEDAGALYGETEVESLCQRFNIANPRAVIQAYRKHRDSDGKDIPDELMELLVAVNSIPIASAEFPYVRSWVAKGHRTATDTQSKTRNREEEENLDMVVMWGCFGPLNMTFKWPHKQGTPGTPLNVDSTVWKDAAAAPAQAPTAPTAGLRWGAGALAARITGPQ
ncbi:unnamed protein product [Pleuronectes platessa]|uniref:Uncharacterized protein n=1 Tax=Pleuronectes platessa TaxID=8262 RepID=A0A9N7VLK1_PLEPL|nr:unnamed protein product [Pleuronectes platessa]